MGNEGKRNGSSTNIRQSKAHQSGHWDSLRYETLSIVHCCLRIHCVSINIDVPLLFWRFAVLTKSCRSIILCCITKYEACFLYSLYCRCRRCSGFSQQQSSPFRCARSLQCFATEITVGVGSSTKLAMIIIMSWYENLDWKFVAHVHLSLCSQVCCCGPGECTNIGSGVVCARG